LSSKSDSKKIENLTYALLAVASFAVLLGSLLLHEKWPDISAFLHELSFAGFIALIVIMTIERFTRERHLAEARNLISVINKNLFYAIYQRYIPPVVFREVERLLLSCDAFRTNYAITYSIEPIADDQLHYVCAAQSSYELHNRADDEITHVVKLNLEKPLNVAHQPLCKILSVRIGNHILTDEEIAKHTSVGKTQIHFSYPTKVAPQSALKVDVAGTLIKQVTDMELWRTTLPAEGFRVTVSAPNGVTVEANSIHSQPAEVVHCAGNKKTWEISGGLLPTQGMVFWWHTPNLALQGTPRDEAAQRL
jgi:hypothetical protein